MTLRNSCVNISKQLLIINRNVFNASRLSSSSLTESKTDEPVFSVEEVEDKNVQLEAEIEAKRNKSRLTAKHLCILKGLPPPPGSDDFHKSLKYKRKMYGLYGKASGIDAGTLWPNKPDLDEIREFEAVAHPYTFHEMISRASERRAEERRIIEIRQKKIANNLKKLSQWMQEVETKKEKKFKELAAAKEKKDKMLEEVRKQLGYTVDVKDEKFKLALLQKEKDLKKQAKEEKSKAKQERLLRALNQEPS